MLTVPLIRTLFPSRVLLVGLVLIATVGFSSKAIFIKLIYAQGVSLEATMLYRVLMALPFYFLILMIQLRREVQRVSISMTEYFRMGVVGIMGYYFASFFDLKGLETVSVNLERMILYLYPSFIFLSSVFLGKKRISWVSTFSLVLAYVGIAVTFLSDAQGSGRYSIMGVAFVVLSAVCFAVYVMGSEKHVIRVGSIRYTCYAMTGASVAIVVHFITIHGAVLPVITDHAMTLIFGMAILSTVMPSLLFSLGVKHLGALDVSVVGMIGPVAAVIMSSVFLGEAFTVYHLVGLFLVLAGAGGLAFIPKKA
ncbi:MAG: hypothetical protein COB04_03930 [Gammaproteobacteria bacterium]|nr:MAG: hypothetical protein COB04_03930 [Gammaproteobacteria bacterium]